VRQLIFEGPGLLRWQELPEPDLEGPGQALVRPLAVATCDLDGPLVRGETPLPAPVALGHECVGEVAAVGSEVAASPPETWWSSRFRSPVASASAAAPD
jgi:alcohol dehydrogenase